MWVRVMARVRVACGPGCTCSIKIHVLQPIYVVQLVHVAQLVHVVSVRVSIRVTCG